MSIDTTAIEKAPQGDMVVSGAMTPSDVVRQVALIQQVMGEVMKDGEHYGKIPGCGDKPSLLQPGAQILALTFRLAPKFEIDERKLDGGNVEFMIRCELYSITSGQLVGMGVGFASTLESKWRFRTGPVEFTGDPVPGNYWNLRKTDPKGALELIGGKGHQTKKNPDSGAWEIVIAGDNVENDNPADVVNTALKIGSKRAFVHAVLNTTAASDMFTQDIEDLNLTGAVDADWKPAATAQEGARETSEPPAAPQEPSPAETADARRVAKPTLDKINALVTELKDADALSDDKLAEMLYVTYNSAASTADLTVPQGKHLLERLEAKKAELATGPETHSQPEVGDEIPF